ncbi:ATP-binding protein [Taklimakanibacter deserti]|uniref:ATP-binding protein n=1 Tax=Taklimakanibacter deserti TaxID=2267839 RepID=UPI000E65CE05
MTDQAPLAPPGVFEFGPFRLLPARKLLLLSDQPVRLGSRALDILIMLVERSGELVGKDEIIARVWPNTFVEEGSLRVHVAAIRRALGDGQAGKRYIANVPGRGYQFLAQVERAAGQPAAGQPSPASGAGQGLPLSLARIVGRDDTVRLIAARLVQSRFITIVGPGGIGKTTVALAVVDALAQSFADGARFVDLAPIGNSGLVASAVASALGLPIRTDDPATDLAAALADRKMLIVLDSCEHVTETAALLAEALRKGAPGVHLLATSREPLRAEGERVHRLSPLATPLSPAGLTAAQALAFPAIQLFVERAAASLDGFTLSDSDTPLVVDICRRLDGIALAIEIVAGRVDTFGIAGIAELLNYRFGLLLRGRRTALPRHQTLSSAIDWSYTLLPEWERVIFRRFAVFAGGATLPSASAVTAKADMAASDAVEAIANLVAKSLVTADVMGTTARYRLLDTTRAYAREKLIESGELEPFTRRHAEHYKELFERAEMEWSTRASEEWFAVYGADIDNVRAALDWTFSPDGDGSIGAALTIAAEPLWTYLSLIDECRRRVEQALAGLPPESHGTRRHMQLLAALGSTLLYGNEGGGRGVREIGAIWAQTLEIAEKLDDIDYRLKALWGSWIDHFNRGEHRAALELARKFRDLAANASASADQSVGDRMIGFSLHLLGDLADARRHIERMLGSYVAPLRRSHVIRFQFDQRITAEMTLAQILWLQGLPDQAMRTAEAGVEEATALGHAMSLCNILAQAACPIALLTGDLEAAHRFIALLLATAAKNALNMWEIWGRCFHGLLLTRSGDPALGLEELRKAFSELPPARFALRYTAFLGELAEALSNAGQVAQGVAAIDKALERSRHNEELWCLAELLRIKGQIVLKEGGAHAAQASEQHMMQSLAWAGRQGALAWELRTATSLARRWREEGRAEAARDLLAPIYARFHEGFGTADLIAAHNLLQALR